MENPNDGVTLTSVEHPHSVMSEVEEWFDLFDLDINEHQGLIRCLEAMMLDRRDD
jgi:hypothetical protein